MIKKMIFTLSARFEENKTLKAIRMGFILLMPIVIINSFGLVLLYLPLPEYQEALTSPRLYYVFQGLQAIHMGCMQYFSILVAISISWGFARVWNVPAYHSVILPALSSICFLLFIGVSSPTFQVAYLGNPGMLSSVVSTVLASRLYLALVARGRQYHDAHRYRMDPYLYGVINTAFPIIGILFVFLMIQSTVVYVSGWYCFQAWFTHFTKISFMAIADSPLLAGNLFASAVQLLWFAGIHGQNVLYEINDNYYGSLVTINLVAQRMGDMPGHTITRVFNNVFLNMGGSGAMISFVMAVFVFSRDKTVRTIAKIAAVPSLFNVSEILNFGIPIILNPVFFIPFICVPVLNMTVAYYATIYHFVPVINNDIAWVTPVFLSGYVATGSVNGVILQGVLLVADFLFYAPFVKLNDMQRHHHFQLLVRQLEQEYQHLEQINEPLRLQDLREEVRVTADLMMSDLVEAIKENRLFLVYQPQFDRAGRFIGVEALLRWNHPQAGFIYPPLIIALAKAGELLPDLEKFIFHEACHSISKLDAFIAGDYKLSVNITGESLKYDTLEETIQDSVDEFKINAEKLWIEITEQDAMESSPLVLEKLFRLQDRGHHLLIDDFGMGHTSIIYLQTNIFSVVKLDGSITRNVLQDANCQEIIASLTSLCKSLQLLVVAEFVETVPQRDKLAELGCDAFQGYLYSKPIPLDEIIALVCDDKLS